VLRKGVLVVYENESCEDSDNPLQKIELKDFKSMEESTTTGDKNESARANFSLVFLPKEKAPKDIKKVCFRVYNENLSREEKEKLTEEWRAAIIIAQKVEPPPQPEEEAPKLTHVTKRRAAGQNARRPPTRNFRRNRAIESTMELSMDQPGSESPKSDTKKRSGSTPLVALRPPGSKKPTLEVDTTAEETPPSSDQLEKSEDEKKMDSISKTKAPEAPPLSCKPKLLKSDSAADVPDVQKSPEEEEESQGGRNEPQPPCSKLKPKLLPPPQSSKPKLSVNTDEEFYSDCEEPEDSEQTPEEEVADEEVASPAAAADEEPTVEPVTCSEESNQPPPAKVVETESKTEVSGEAATPDEIPAEAVAPLAVENDQEDTKGCTDAETSSSEETSSMERSCESFPSDVADALQGFEDIDVRVDDSSSDETLTEDANSRLSSPDSQEEDDAGLGSLKETTEAASIEKSLPAETNKDETTAVVVVVDSK